LEAFAARIGLQHLLPESTAGLGAEGIPPLLALGAVVALSPDAFVGVVVDGVADGSKDVVEPILNRHGRLQPLVRRLDVLIRFENQHSIRT
jgi:hypothetical protein